jgi:hypothetical protein
MDRNKPQKLLNSIKYYTFIIITFCQENWEELPELVITMKQITNTLYLTFISSFNCINIRLY